MKNKEFYTEDSLPLYEVTEMTMEEALLAITDYRGNKTRSGILSQEVLKRYDQQQYPDQVKH